MNTHQKTFKLSPDQQAFVTAKVESGEYDSADAVVHAAIAELQEKDRAFEDWLRKEVAPVYDAMVQDPSRGIPIDEAFERLRKRAAERTKTRS
jgi:antitoxin ParD1/3/4